jgi:predicted nucleic acid-binding protein
MQGRDFVDQRNDAELPKKDSAARTPNMFKLWNAEYFMNCFSGVTVRELYRVIKKSLCTLRLQYKNTQKILNNFSHLP